MKLATFRLAGRRFVGLVSYDGSNVAALSFNADERGALPVVEQLVAGKPLPGVTSPALALSAVQLDAPVPRPRRNVFCVGRNYRAHAQELKGSVFKADEKPIDQWPIVFSKVPESVIAPGAPIRLPGAGVSEQIDYEAELAVVIGRGGRNIPARDAMAHVWGYTIINDVTARDVQMRHGQWHLGKSFDTFCPMGPWLVSADELDGRNVRVRLWVNDELRQNAPTSDLIFDIPTLIETISRGITLYPGDLIATGTPAGVGMGFDPPRWLKAGDVVEINVPEIGTLRNRVVAET
jgi:2-keto-4-pentenoate hydratase/2-oxohepta-3-ene-1,7-dioic acid hydratase in catechol pathway